MKITIKEKKQNDYWIPFDSIPVGTVYQIENRVILLKLENNKAVILKYSNGMDWFEIAAKGFTIKGFGDQPATKIFGKLTEMIIEPI